LGKTGRATKKMDEPLIFRLIGRFLTPTTFSEKTCDFIANEEELISSVKRRAAEKFSIIGSQRWFCKGRIISDSMTVKQCKIPDGFVIQVIVSPPITTETRNL